MLFRHSLKRGRIACNPFDNSLLCARHQGVCVLAQAFATNRKTTIFQIERWGIVMEQKLDGTAKIVHHKGVEIFIVDLSGKAGRELTQAMKEGAKAIIPKTIGRRDCVIVYLFNNCMLLADSVEYAIKIQNAMDGAFIASAIVGMTEIQKMAIDISRSLKKLSFVNEFFDSEAEAMDWAVEQHKNFALQP